MFCFAKASYADDVGHQIGSFQKEEEEEEKAVYTGRRYLRL